MFHKKKVSLLALSLVLIGTVLMGSSCGPTEGPAAQVSLVDEIQKRGTIRVAVVPLAPFALRDPQSEEWFGIHIDMATALAEELGVELEIAEAEWGNIIAGLQAEKYDIAWAALFQTPARAMVVDFMEPDYRMGMCILTYKDRTDINTLEDVNKPETKIVVHTGTSTEMHVQRDLPQAERVSIAQSGTVAYFAELQSKRVDVMPIDSILVDAYLMKYPDLKSIPEGCPHEAILWSNDLGGAIMPGDPHFLNFLNTFVKYMKLTGKVDEFHKKWAIPEYLITE